MTMKRSNHDSAATGDPTSPRRGGAVIVVVLALMAMLAFLGLFFYDFVQVEQHTAENFARTTTPLEGIDPESLINAAIRQIVTHTETEEGDRGSALANFGEGSKMSLLAHELGTITKSGSNYVPRDYELRNGRGLTVVKGAGSPFQYNGPDTASAINSKTVAELILNRSRAANGTAPDGTYDYEPDVGYTYPDLNGIFLAYDYIIDDLGTSPRIIKPSFMDLDLFRNLLENDTSRWYTAASTQRWMFRPHAEHVIPGTTTKRFLPAFPGITAAALKLGPWTSNGVDYTGLDADADNDGNFDSIYLDLGLAPVTLEDGSRTLIPITFWKIEDLNGLIDLNAAGNPALFLAANRATSVNLNNDIYNLTRSAHYSNYGLTRAEVNPMWALFSNPSSANAAQLAWDAAFYRTSSKSFNLRQLQNTEMAMLLFGSATSMGQSVSSSHSFTDTLDDLQGRFGDSALIPSTPNGPFAAPGNLGEDEDHNPNTAISEDANENGMIDMGEDVNSNGVLDDPILPRGIHPTDVAGSGAIPFDSATGARQLSTSAYPNSPMSYPTYTGYWQTQPQPGGSFPSFRSQQIYQSLPTTMLENTFDFRKDDPAEVNRYSFTNADRDNLYRPYEIAALHLGDYDYTRSSLFSRTRQLAPFNFNMTAFSRDVRRQFTTESWTRREFVFPYNPSSSRTFEFNDNDTDGARRFPPAFGGSASRHELGTIQTGDPFRPVVRRLLTTRIYPTGSPVVRNRVYFPQMPLELNRILDDQAGSAAFDSLGNPTFRELTPHVVDEDFDGDGTLDANEDLNQSGFLDTFSSTSLPAMVYGSADTPTVPFASRFATRESQEWWAQYDRQRLAQDIFVLLVTLCGQTDMTAGPAGTLDLGEDTNANGRLDTGEDTNGNGVLDSPIREMAQFAVNLVDQMDPDDVITRFAYDTDWTSTTNGWNPTASSPYVEGVEAQKLSFSEVLWLKQTNSSSDVAETYHRDNDGHHQFLYIELKNCTPFPVSLTRDSWRIVRLDPTKSDSTFNSWDSANHLASVEFRSTTRNVAAGANFVVASHDGRLFNSTTTATTIGSDIYVNKDATPTFEVVVPTTSAIATVTGTTNPAPAPQCDLDLCHSDHNGEYQITSTFAPENKLVMYQASMAVQDTETRMVLSLQRRRNLNTHGKATLNQNDWVEVDRFDFENPTQNLFQLTSAADILTKLAETRSMERFHHLVGAQTQGVGYNSATVPATARANLSNHSLDLPGSTKVNTVSDPSGTGGTDRSAAYQTLWQPHHDRDFTSAYDLLSVPVCGPDAVLQRLHDQSRALTSVGGINGWGNSLTSVRYAASTRFLPPTTDTTSIPWTRLLNFLTLPEPTDRVQKRYSTQFVQSRTFGKININMIRSPKVLAGLLDDDRINPNSWTLEENVDTSRQWWTVLKNLRDGIGALGPGSLNARPFQDPGGHYTGTEGPGYGVEYGLLRHPYTTYPPATPSIGALEARPAADITTDVVDIHTRHRLLKKLANNTTTRSQMFAIWGGIDFFEGTASGSGYQVGAKAADVQTCRWFFVVDMSRLEEAYDQSTKSFDWRKFIVYRQRLE